MRRNLAAQLLWFPSILIVTGCAFTNETVPVTFQRPQFDQTVRAESAIAVHKLRDARGVKPHLLAQKGLQYRTTGEYLTEREVAEIVTDALKETLSGLGYKLDIREDEALTLEGDILKFVSNRIVGGWSGATEGSIQLSLKLTDGKTGALLWSEVISGYSKIDTQVDRAAHRRRAAEAALQDVMKKFGESPTFKKVVQSHASK